jgi:hypothetical protein
MFTFAKEIIPKIRSSSETRLITLAKKENLSIRPKEQHQEQNQPKDPSQEKRPKGSATIQKHS